MVLFVQREKLSLRLTTANDMNIAHPVWCEGIGTPQQLKAGEVFLGWSSW